MYVTILSGSIFHLINIEVMNGHFKWSVFFITNNLFSELLEGEKK